MAKRRTNRSGEPRPAAAAVQPHTYRPKRQPVLPPRSEWPPGFQRWLAGVMVQRYYIAPLGTEEGWLRIVVDLARGTRGRALNEQDALTQMLTEFHARQPAPPPPEVP